VIPKLKLQLLRDVLNQEGFIKRTASAINTAVYGQPNGNTAYNTNNSVSTFNKVNHSNNPSLQLNENNLLDRLPAKFRQAELANNTPNTLADTSSGNKDYPIHSRILIL
jgi:hypothetical protein